MMVWVDKIWITCKTILEEVGLHLCKRKPISHGQVVEDQNLHQCYQFNNSKTNYITDREEILLQQILDNHMLKVEQEQIFIDSNAQINKVNDDKNKISMHFKNWYKITD